MTEIHVIPEAAFAAARSAMSGPFVWGARDCVSSACAAWAMLYGRDPMGAVRGSYDGPVGAGRIVKAAGGLVLWCDATFGLSPTDQPDSGDLVLIAQGGLWGGALSLCIRPGEYAAKGAAGVVVAGGTIMGAWTCRRF